MKRNHIHFAKGLPSDKTVLSGIRKDCQIFIYIDLAKALREGIKFFKSSNEVILSPGDENGVIDPKYFLKVINSKGGEQTQLFIDILNIFLLYKYRYL